MGGEGVPFRAPNGVLVIHMPTTRRLSGNLYDRAQQCAVLSGDLAPAVRPLWQVTQLDAENGGL